MTLYYNPYIYIYMCVYVCVCVCVCARVFANISVYGHACRNELISDVLLWTPTYGQAKAGRPARTYIQQLCEDTGCGHEDLPEVMNDREKWRERVRDIRACGKAWWWGWYTYIYIYIYKTPVVNIYHVLLLS